MVALGSLSLPTHDLSSDSKIMQVIMKDHSGHKDVMVKSLKPLPDFIKIELQGFIN